MKSFGSRLPGCTARNFHSKVAEHIPQELAQALEPVLATIASLTERIKDYDRKLETMAEDLYPETSLLRQVRGVGSLTALAFVLTLEDSERFSKSRDVGAYLGLVPESDQIRGQRPREEHFQARQRDDAQAIGRQCPVHPRSLRRGLRPEAPRGEDSFSGRQERQEESSGGGGP